MNQQQRAALCKLLQHRFEDNPARHPKLRWTEVQAKLDAQPAKLLSLAAMESSGGEPDLVGQDSATGDFLFYDCSAESPSGRRSVCYDRQGLESRKENRPENNAVDMAAAMGIQILTEEQYRQLQTLGAFDLKTSSWLTTPADIRERGGAIFADCRYGRVFVYHNGAQSYYAARGFRGALRV